MQIASKNLASVPKCVSAKQLRFSEFEGSFERKLNPKNRWLILSKLPLWDELCSIYWKHVP
jgi:transposase, IS5 family